MVRHNIIKSDQVPEGENVYLKKGITGEYRVVHPWRREDGSLNWFAIFFGSKGNLVMLIVILLIAFGLYLGILDLIGSYQQVAADPCAFCEQSVIDITNITLKGG